MRADYLCWSRVTVSLYLNDFIVLLTACCNNRTTKQHKESRNTHTAPHFDDYLRDQ
jgi:hypothetical protein